MKYIELSIKDLQDRCRLWAAQISLEYQPDFIIYVADAGYLIGKVFSEVFDAPLAGISATRKGNGIKGKLRPLFRFIPVWLRNRMIQFEIESNLHKRNEERNVSFRTHLSKHQCTGVHRILIVDDSVDTGHSLVSVKKKVEETFSDADIKMAALNVWGKSTVLIQTDYALYKDTIIKAPMSKDSKQYDEFIGLMKAGKNE